MESTAPGLITLSYCFDAVACVYGFSNVTLGADPTISHESHATGIEDDSVGGGETGSTLQYSIELFDNPGKTAPETIGFKGNDFLNATGVGGALYRMTVTDPTKALDLQDSDGTIESYEGVAFGSLSSVTSISLVPNTVYYVKKSTPIAALRPAMAAMPRSTLNSSCPRGRPARWAIAPA